MEDKIRSWAVILLVSLSLGACSTMDRPWDPDISRGESLFDQIPNEDGGALKRCAGHLPPSERKAWQTGRC